MEFSIKLTCKLRVTGAAHQRLVSCAFCCIPYQHRWVYLLYSVLWFADFHHPLVWHAEGIHISSGGGRRDILLDIQPCLRVALPRELLVVYDRNACLRVNR